MRDGLPPVQRSERGLEYERTIHEFQRLLSSHRPEDVETVMQAKESLARVKELKPGDVYVDKTLQSLSIQYANDEYIGERLVPYIDVDQDTGYYFKYDKRTRLAVPSLRLAEGGRATQINDGRSKATYGLEDYGAENGISVKTVNQADAPLNEMAQLTIALSDIVALDREIRIASALTTSGNYDSANTSTLSGTGQWSDYTNSDPVADILDAVSKCWSGRGPGRFWGFCGVEVWNKLCKHPKVLDLFKYNGSSPGLATPDMLAGWFGLAGILVGRARKDTANSGQTASYSRVWGKHFGIVRVADMAMTDNAAFAYNFRARGGPFSYTWLDERLGRQGKWFTKVTTGEDVRIVANDTGYLYVNAVA